MILFPSINIKLRKKTIDEIKCKNAAKIKIANNCNIDGKKSMAYKIVFQKKNKDWPLLLLFGFTQTFSF